MHTLNMANKNTARTAAALAQVTPEDTDYLVSVSRYGARKCYPSERHGEAADRLIAAKLLRRNGLTVYITAAGRRYLDA